MTLPEQNEDADTDTFERLLRDLMGEMRSRLYRRRPRLRKWPHQYVLDDNNRPIPFANVLAWSRWMDENAARVVVGSAHLPNGYWVSTCFLGLDHNMTGSRLHLFETMLKRAGAWETYQWRYSTWERAEAGHRAVVRLFSAENTKAGENAAALDFPMHRVNTHALRSDYANRFEDRSWWITSERIVSQIERSDRPGEIRQAYTGNAQTDADRVN